MCKEVRKLMENKKAYLDAVDIVCGKCGGTEETCVRCPVRLCYDQILKAEQPVDKLKPRKKIVPCDVAIRRFYRMYVKVDEDAGTELVRFTAKNMLIESDDPDAMLVPDPDLEIEEHDIDSISPDWDGVQDDDEEDDEE